MLCYIVYASDPQNLALRDVFIGLLDNFQKYCDRCLFLKCQFSCAINTRGIWQVCKCMSMHVYYPLTHKLWLDENLLGCRGDC